MPDDGEIPAAATVGKRRLQLGDDGECAELLLRVEGADQIRGDVPQKDAR